MITFGDIYIDGFGPFIDFSFNLDKGTVIIVSGRNGSGKTKLFSAFTWALYGEVLNKAYKTTIQTYEWLRPTSFMGTVVSIKFKKGNSNYRVIRFLDYRGNFEDFGRGKDRLIFLKDGVEVPGKKPEVQKAIQDTLGISGKLFIVSVLFGQNMERLMDAKSSDKKEILEEAFSMQFLNIAREKAKAELDRIDSHYRDIYLKSSVITEKLDGLNTWIKDNTAQVKEYGDILANFESVKADEVLSIKAEIASTKSKLSAIPLVEETPGGEGNLWGDLASLKVETERAEDVVANKEQRVLQIRHDLADLTTKRVSLKGKAVCQYCGADLNAKTRREQAEHLKKEMAELANEQIMLLGIIKGMKRSISSNKKQIQEITKQLEEYETLARHVYARKTLLTKLIYLKNTLKAALSKKPPFTHERVLELENKLAKAKAEREGVQKELKSLNLGLQKLSSRKGLYQWLVGDALSNTGLKAYILEYKLGKLNERLAYYQAYVGFLAKLYIDMSSGRKEIKGIIQIKTGDRLRDIPFSDLSGGQAQLVHIAVAFAAFDIINDDMFNIIILDEVFDNLDDTNKEVVASIIPELAKGKTVFMITHLKGLAIRNSINLEFGLSKGITSIR